MPILIREFGIRETCYANYRVAVGLLVGQGWEQRRPTLPKSCVDKARPKVLVFLRLNYLLVGSEWQKQCFSSIAFTLISVYRLDNRCRKCKKTKAFGLVLLFHLQDRVAHFVRNPALSTDQPLRGSWWDSHFFTYPVLFKRHGILFRIMSINKE